ncbi:SpdD-like protein [Streptomyces arenae]|nr:SpdD-like protein [Streptomyces arenae]
MFTPKIPANEMPTGEIIPHLTTPAAAPLDGHPHAPADCVCRPQATAPTPAAASRSAVQMTPGTVLALIGGGTVAALVIGAVLVSMLLAVAITAASVAVVALVVRSVLTNPGRKH